MNNILEQFGDKYKAKDYEFGIIDSIGLNDIYTVETYKGLKLTIQDPGIKYIVGDIVLLGLFNGSTNNAFILKKTNKAYPVAINFIVTNNLN